MASKLVKLHAADNVLICRETIQANELVSIGDESYEISTIVEVGHKVANTHLQKGEKIIRYGVPIGSATADICIGDHVHIHNMKSDYIPSHTRQSKVGE